MEKETLKKLLEVFLDVVNQSCQVRVEDGKCIVTHDFISSYEDAIYLLEDLGLAEDIGAEEYRLNWDFIDRVIS